MPQTGLSANLERSRRIGNRWPGRTPTSDNDVTPVPICRSTRDRHNQHH